MNCEEDYFYVTGQKNSMTSNFLSEDKYKSTKYLLAEIIQLLDKNVEYKKYKVSLRKFFYFQMKRIVISCNDEQKEDFYKFFCRYYGKNFVLNLILNLDKVIKFNGRKREMLYKLIFSLLDARELKEYLRRNLCMFN